MVTTTERGNNVFLMLHSSAVIFLLLSFSGCFYLRTIMVFFLFFFYLKFLYIFYFIYIPPTW